jgi:deoxycytidylate deaminase
MRGSKAEREVVCVLTNNETVVSASHCTDTPPSTTSHCYSEEGCVETSLWDNARCHLTGTAHEEGHLMEEGGWVAISNCRGLVRLSV